MSWKRLLLVLSLIYLNCYPSRYDLTVVGPMLFADGLGRLSISVIDNLKDDLSISFIPTSHMDFTDVPMSICQNLKIFSKRISSVSILFDSLWTKWSNNATKVPNSTIKLAYSMVESTAIPTQWVKLLNNLFDAVIVPDKFLVDVYVNSGVKLPIFVLPCGLYLEDFLNKPIKNKKNKPFAFGMSAGFFSNSKNHELLIDAFAQEFFRDKNVKLRVHGRFGDNLLQKRIYNKIKSLKSNNIEFISKRFTRSQYVEFMSSLDCYVLLSKGEGFSITPREALALGIPCIISDNTAHNTICETGFVKAVKADIKEPAYYFGFGGNCGDNFNTTIDEARKAMREVYENYDIYLSKASQGREWVKQYFYKNLKDKYLALIKPLKVILSDYNAIEDNCIITNSKRLYEKYLKITGKNIGVMIDEQNL